MSAPTTDAAPPPAVATPASTAWQRVEWMGMRFIMPADWAIVRHSLKTDAGELHMVDRRRQRMVLTWIAQPTKPDLAHALSDHAEKARLEDEHVRIDPVAFDPSGAEGWHAHRLTSREGALTRALRWLPTHRRWVELVLPWASTFSPRDGELQRQLLGRFVEAPTGNAITAFGLAAAPPADEHEAWTVTRIDALPGETTVAMRRDGATRDERRRRAFAQVSRLSAASQWFDGDLRKALRKRLPRWCDEPIRLTDEPSGQGQPGRKEALAAISEARSPTSLLNRMLGRTEIRRDRLWLDEAADAVLHVRTLSPRRFPVEPTTLTAAHQPVGTLDAIASRTAMGANP